MLDCQDGNGQVMSGARFPANTTSGMDTKDFNLCLTRPENFRFQGLRVVQALSGKLQVGCHVPFTAGGLVCGFASLQA